MGKVRKDNRKIAAFTLFESVIAITIISVLIGFGTMVYGNIIHAENPLGYHQVKSFIDEKWHELEEGKPALTETFQMGEYEVTQTVKPHRGNKKLNKVTYTATLGERTIWTEKHLLVQENER